MEPSFIGTGRGTCCDYKFYFFSKMADAEQRRRSLYASPEQPEFFVEELGPGILCLFDHPLKANLPHIAEAISNHSVRCQYLLLYER